MAHVGKDKKGYRVRFVNQDGVEKTIRLTGFNKTKCEEIARHVAELVSAKASGSAIERRTANWLGDIGQVIHDKLSRAELIEARVSSSLGDFITGYIERRKDVEPGTITNYHQVRLNLVAFFGYDKPMRSITSADAAAFRAWLESDEGLSENTLRRRCGRARQFFTAAIKAKLIEENPFDGMAVSVGGSKDKARFITEEESQKILKACPDLQWRLIFSLCRYGGMRCPSEVLALTWENVLWDRHRIVVTSPKTKRYKGHETRVIPMFPELASVLNEAYEAAFDRLDDESDVVSGPVVTRYTSADQNMRTTFTKIIKRAGLVPWPKPFQNLRATRETELMETHPAHVVVSWIGHSETVARKHYLQTTDAHFQQAVSRKPDPVAVQQADSSSEPNVLVAVQVAGEACNQERIQEPTEQTDTTENVVFCTSTEFSASLPDEENNPTRARTWNDRTKICCVTITPSGYVLLVQQRSLVVAKTDADFAELQPDFVE